MTFDFDNLIGRDKIALIYVAYYGRLPDPDGFAFWNNFFGQQTFNGASSESAALQVTDFFLDQNETRSNYPFFDDPASATVADVGIFLDEVYFNLFNRPPDAAGKDFWSEQIASRLAVGDGFSDLLTQIIEGAQADDISAIDNKLQVATYYIDNIGDNFDLAQATRIAQDVTSDANSATDVIADIDAFLAEGAEFFDAGRSDTHFLVSELSGGDIALIDIENATSTIVANTGLSFTTDIAVLPTGDLLVSDFDTVYRYSFASDTLTPLVTLATGINALETDENGALYASGPFGPQLYRVDTDSGAAEQIGTLPAGSAGDISVSRDSLFVTLVNDDLVFLSADNPGDVSVVQQNGEISSFYGIVQMGDQLFAGAGDRIIDITDADTYVDFLTIDIAAFGEVSGSSYIYDSLVDYLLG